MSKTVEITARLGLNVRARPSAFSRKVGALQYGARVEVLEQRGVWGRIDTPYRGWIHLGYTRPVEDGASDGWAPGATAIDLSHWNRLERLFWHNRPWLTFVKATQGTYLLDKTFGERWAQMRWRDWRRGAYHFFDPDEDGKAQARAFLRVVGPQTGEFVALDLETFPKQHMPFWVDAQIKRWVHEVLERVPAERMFIYTRRDVWLYYYAGRGEDWAARLGVRLWVADYRPVTQPLAVPGWERPDMWQYTDRGRWPGVKGNVDLNRVSEAFVERFA